MIGIKGIGNAVKNLRVGTVGAIIAGVGLVIGAIAIAFGNKNTFVDTDVLEESDTAAENVETHDVEAAVEE